jgi:hypothetical protein
MRTDRQTRRSSRLKIGNEFVGWINHAEDRVQNRDVVNTLINCALNGGGFTE